VATGGSGDALVFFSVIQEKGFCALALLDTVRINAASAASKYFRR